MMVSLNMDNTFNIQITNETKTNTKYKKNTCVKLKTTEINRHITKLGIYMG